ncbi:RNA polymerase sigma factor [Agrococcus terreus]|uniref:DNA-directed RNA polymerase sigma-70 factor n=1 Tax=Agrococcus terreus TaxID=574649 RepID=A0ABQ2KQS4_9MICO|nr:sigma-70 family RNA polymerase sigma factor [Agrococcus terreus]GGN89380.1 DNA-directed RNA polymerase sigma-70 factor [Agrococcus terreus]
MDLSQTDEHLWRAVVRGDGVAFAAIFDRHGDRVWRHAWRMMQHRQDTEDVTAAVFAEAWRKRARVRIVDDSVLPWLLVTATNCARNARRSIRRNERLIAHIPRGEDAPDPAVVAGDRFERLDAGSAVAAAMRELSDKDAALVSLVMLEDVPLPDAARALGMTYGAAKTRISRAKQRLRGHLETAAEELPA